MSLMERFADPELFVSLSLGEKLAGSTVTMIMGMGITFLVLAILWGFIEIMGKIVVASERRKPEDCAGHVAGCENKIADSRKAGELAAVISAAVSAYEGAAKERRVEVRRISKNSPAAMLRCRMTGACGKQTANRWKRTEGSFARGRDLRNEEI